MDIPVPNNITSLRTALLFKVDEMQVIVATLKALYEQDPDADLKAAGYTRIEKPGEDFDSLRGADGELIDPRVARKIFSEYDKPSRTYGAAGHLTDKLIMSIHHSASEEMANDPNRGLVSLPEYIDFSISSLTDNAEYLSDPKNWMPLVEKAKEIKGLCEAFIEQQKTAVPNGPLPTNVRGLAQALKSRIDSLQPFVDEVRAQHASQEGLLLELAHHYPHGFTNGLLSAIQAASPELCAAVIATSVRDIENMEQGHNVSLTPMKETMQGCGLLCEAFFEAQKGKSQGWAQDFA